MTLLRRFLLLLAISAIAIGIKAQTIGDPEMIAQDLDSSVWRTSGLIYHNGKLWTHTDNANVPVIYSLDPYTGEVLETKYISGVSCIDWEDMAKSPTHLFIGDFGNNATGSRTDMKIHRIKWEDIENEDLDTVEARSISFGFNSSYYPEADASEDNTKFDCEAMLVMNDTIYLFTKNWRDTDCYIYAIPNKANYEWNDLDPIDVVNLEYMVTGADYDYSSNTVALCGYTFDNSGIPSSNPYITLLYGFSGHDFFSGSIETSEFTSPSSVIFQSTGITYNRFEGITFRDRRRLWVSNERYTRSLSIVQVLTIPAHLREFPINNYQYINFDNETAYEEEPPAIEISFEASDTLILKGGNVTFTESCTQNPTGYNWTFEGGSPSSSTEQTPSAVTYDIAGHFAVALTASNENCELTLTKPQYIHVLDTATALFTANSNTICTGQSVEFSDNSLGAYTHSWIFEGGIPETSTEENPIVTYETVGTYGVTLIVTNPLSTDTTYIEEYIEVVEPIETTITAPDGMDVTQGNSITFAGNEDAVSWEWTFEGGTPETSTEQNPTVTYEEPGTYSVSLTTSNGICESNSTIEGAVTVYPPISASILADVTTICSQSEVHFAATGIGVTEYHWEFEGGSPATSAEQMPAVEYAEAGTYSVTLIVTNPVDSDTIVMENYIEVVPRVYTALIGVPEGEFATVGDIVTFENVSENATSWQWTFEGGNPSTSTEENPSVTYNIPGHYRITLIASNEVCSGEMIEYGITIYPQIEFNFSADDTSVCSGGQIQFRSTDNQGSAGYLHWEFEGGTPEISDAQNPIITYNEPGVYRVSLQVANMADSKYMAIDSMITVYQSAIADFDVSDSLVKTGSYVTFTNRSQYADNVEWVFSGGSPYVSNEENPRIRYNDEGLFWVSLDAWNEHCRDRKIVDDIVEVRDSIDNGIDEISTHFSVFPNPTSGIINIENSEIPYSYSIFTQNGALVIEANGYIEGNSKVDVSHLPAGNYSLTITTGKENKTFNFIKL